MKMIKHVMARFLILFFIISIPGTVAFADEKKQELSKEDQEIMKILDKQATPGEKHKHLEYFIGEWESLLKLWPEPGKEPMVHKQEIKVKSIMAGRFLWAVIKGEMMGKPYETYVFTGYDNYKKKFFAIQLSTLNTNYYLSTGTLDKTGKIRTETFLYDDPISGQQYEYKSVTTLISQDKYSYVLFYYEPGDPQKKQIKSMEIIYTRKK